MNSDSWCSPPEVTVPLGSFYRRRRFLDPCSNPSSIVGAAYTYIAGGLHLPWDRDWYMNNPYSRMLPWLKKATTELELHGTEGVGLVPVATSTEWWSVMVDSDPLLCFTKRLSFLDATGRKRMGARFDTVMPVWASSRRKNEFVRLFAPILRYVVDAKDWRSMR